MNTSSGNLPANELGEMGESRFREICAAAQLICNKSDRDLAGWDFIVEFPFNDNESVALDNRRKPISCHVQVKTLRETSNRFEMRLSSAERLAKESKPSFVYVFKVNEQLEFVESFLIHMLDEPLAVVLARLRKESASAPPVKINKKKITLPVNKNSVRLEPTGIALRNALEFICGYSMDSYISNKRIQLENMGFDGRPYEMKATFHLGSDEEIVDAFLGIKKDIPISNIQAFQTRFGIRLPEVTPAGAGIVNIHPSPSDRCTIFIRRSALDSPAVFEGDVFNPAIPKLPIEKLKILVKSDFFSIEIKRNGARLTSTIGASVTQTLQSWLNYWRAMQIFAEGEGIIQIVPSKMGRSMDFPIPGMVAGMDVKTCSYWIDVCEQAIGLLQRAGVVNEPTVTMSSLEEHANQILIFNSVLRGENCFNQFSTEEIEGIKGLSLMDAVSADYVVIGDVVLAYYGIVTFSLERGDNLVQWTATGFVPKEFSVIHKFPEQYEEFLERAKTNAKVATVLARRPLMKDDA